LDCSAACEAAALQFGHLLANRSGSIRVNRSEASQRRIVHYAGQVQGVGFRYTTQRIAAGYEVAGFVENLPDGRVRVVCEGASRELDQFLAELEERMAGYIDRRNCSTEAASGEFASFAIRH
jgi:acylphosphatase